MTITAWQQFLAAQGYTIDTDLGLASIDSATDQGKPQLIPLTHMAAYQLVGPDGSKFLQGQTSCDLDQLSTEHSLLGSNTNPKGGVINFFRLMKVADEQLLMRFAKSIADKATANFSKYIVFSKAELENADDHYQGLGLQGTDADSLIAKITGSAPATINGQIIVDQAIIVRHLGTKPRYEIWAPSEQLQAIWETLQEGAQLVGTQSWLAEDMASGIAVFDDQAQEEFLPQMLNLHMIDAVNFHKGCYTGQEIITRLQYRGKLNKCMYLASMEGKLPAAGTKIWSPDRSIAGEVLSGIQQTDGSCLLQIVIHMKTADTALRLQDENGPELTMIPLPYTVDPEWRP